MRCEIRPRAALTASSEMPTNPYRGECRATMRWYWLAVAFAFLSAGGAAFVLVRDHGRLADFCRDVELGEDLARIRRLAYREGFEPRIEPHAQMRVVARSWSYWHQSPPSCRIFFNDSRTVEYRIWQGDS